MESQGLRYNIQFESKLMDNPLYLHLKNVYPKLKELN